MEDQTALIPQAQNLVDFAGQGHWPSLLVLAGAVLTAVLLHAVIYRVVCPAMLTRRGVGASMVRRARRPARLGLVLLALFLALPATELNPAWQGALQHIALVLLIILTGWTSILLLTHLVRRSIARHRIDTEDNLAARKYVTQARVLQRTASIVLTILTAIAAALTFDSVQEYGVSLFASAGAAGLILGLAARPVLSNLIAGVQIALTQPIRLEDVVIVEGEWGWIEEIYATYVVVRIWDWRRMVVPLSYFIEKPFQNWTRESASIIGAVFWYVDYTVPVADVREKLEELVEKSPLWDRKVVNLQVTDTDKDTVTLRGLMSARTSPKAWDLRCEIREKLLMWLQENHPGALPRLRGEFRMCGDGAG